MKETGTEATWKIFSQYFRQLNLLLSNKINNIFVTWRLHVSLIKCATFLTGQTIIYKLENSKIYDAFYLTMKTNTDSKERSFSYEPIMPFRYVQNLSEEETIKFLANPNLICDYEPENNVKDSYRIFVEHTSGTVFYKYLVELGPSKEWLEHLEKNLNEKNRNISNDGNIIKGAFSPQFKPEEEV